MSGYTLRSRAGQQGSRQRSGSHESDTSTLNRSMAQLDFKTVGGKNSGSLVGPFDHDNRRSGEIIVESD